MLEILDQSDEANASHKSLKLSGAIAYDQVEFAYPTRSDIKLLKSISFSIRPGEKVALVGPSGSGDRASGGNVVWGYHSRKHCLGKPDASHEEIYEAALKANALEFIESFPEKLDTLLVDRGAKLSGGQRQRVAIARAILNNPSILILDEATSSLDARSEQLVQDALEKLMENRTTIVIPHRLSTIRKVDRILVIKAGQIAEAGFHDELSSLDNGIYSNLLNFNGRNNREKS